MEPDPLDDLALVAENDDFPSDGDDDDLLSLPSQRSHTQDISLARALLHSRLTGIRPFTANTLPPSLQQRASIQARDVPRLAAQVSESLQALISEPSKHSARVSARAALANVNVNLMSEDVEMAADFAQAFGDFGGVVAVCRFLFAFNTPSILQDSTRPLLTELVKLCLRVLREVIYQNETLAEGLSQQDAVIVALGPYLTMAETFQMAELLIEDLVACRRSLFDFSKFGLLPSLIPRLTPGQLAWFCRLASAAWTEPEDRLEQAQPRSFALLRERHALEMADLRGENLVGRNQALFLESSVFLPRIVAILADNPPLHPINHPAGNSWRDMHRPRSPPSLGDIAEMVARTASLALSALTGGRVTPPNSPPLQRPASPPLESVELLWLVQPPTRDDMGDFVFFTDAHQRDVWTTEQRTELILVLCLLCSGPHKRRVQDELVQRLGVVDVLTARFDACLWDPKYRPERLPLEERPHGPDCACNPQSALKTHILRLVHNLCDRETSNLTNKLALFAPPELELIRAEQPGRRIALTFPHFALDAKPLPGLPGGQYKQAHGLAWRVAAVLVCDDYADEDADVDLRFWLCAVLEALLRGSNQAIRLLVASWGVLHAAVKALLDEPLVAPRGVVVQTSFDLLGELVKDCVPALEWLSGRHVDSLGEGLPAGDLERLIRIASTNLVSGNVFLRSLFLTLHRSRSVQSPFLESTRDLLLHSAMRAQLCRCLWTIISVLDASQENLCALNTAIVLYTLARLESDEALAQLLRETRAVDLAAIPELASQLVQAAEPDVHFRGLLWFWSAYYSCRQIDRDSLEFSSGVAFADLKKTADLLCALDGSATALLPAGVKAHVPFSGIADVPKVSTRRFDPNKRWSEV